jgi:hypothetical protein
LFFFRLDEWMDGWLDILFKIINNNNNNNNRETNKKMLTKKLKLKDKLSQFLIIILVCTNEINFELNKINSNYYNYATTIPINTTKMSNNKTTTFEQNITNDYYLQYDEYCLVTILPSLVTKQIILNYDYNNHTFVYKSTYLNTIYLMQENKLGKTGYYSKSFTSLSSNNTNKCNITPPSPPPNTTRTTTTTTNNNKNNNDYMELTLFNPSTKYLIRKTITKKQYNEFKSYYKINSTNNNNSTTKKVEAININNESPSITTTLTTTTTTTTTTKPATTTSSSSSIKFFYNFETDRIHDLNLMYKKYSSSNSDDHIIMCALIQDKFSYNFYLHLKTKLGKNFFNQLHSDFSTLQQNRFYFKFKKTNTLLLRFKSIEFYNIIKYEINAPLTPSCGMSMSDLNNLQNDTTTSEYLPSQFLNCDQYFDELAFYQEIQQREAYRKFKEIQTFIINDNLQNNNYDQFKCILTEYFGKIFTCDGRLLSSEEFAFLKSKNLNYHGLLVLVNIKFHFFISFFTKTSIYL